MRRGRSGARLLSAGTGCLSGALYCLSIPKADLYLLGWVCLLPCFLLLARRPTPAPFLLGLSAGLVSGVGRIYWLGGTLQTYGALGPWASYGTTCLLIGYLSLYPAAFFALCSRWHSPSPLFPWAAASGWVLLEWGQNWVISGFPWELLGYSQYLNRPVLQLASVTGVYGLSFVLVLSSAVLAQLLARRTAVLPLAAPPATAVLAVLVWGLWRCHTLDRVPQAGLEVGIVQGNVPQDEKWTSTAAWTTSHYLELGRELAGEGRLDLMVFPETALPFYLRDPSRTEYRDSIAELARQTQTPLLVGSLERQADRVYNRAFLFDAAGAVVGYADKVHLVPFGEYLPLPWLFRYLEGLTAESGAFAAGAGHAVLRLPDHGPAFGVFICYESIFPEIARSLTRNGAVFLLNITNDAWFGHSAAPYQHFSMAVVRAVENGRPLLRVANTGISGTVSASGLIASATGLGETVARRASLAPRSATTFYTDHGDAFLLACALFLAGSLAARLARRSGRGLDRSSTSGRA